MAILGGKKKLRARKKNNTFDNFNIDLIESRKM